MQGSEGHREVGDRNQTPEQKGRRGKEFRPLPPAPSAAPSRLECFPFPLFSAARAGDQQEEGSSPEGGRHSET